MENNQFAPFYVGQEVEAVVTSSLLQKGRKYTVSAIEKRCCYWAVYIGVAGGNIDLRCDCGKIYQIRGKSFPFYHGCFRALTPAMEAVTFEKITEQHPVSVN